MFQNIRRFVEEAWREVRPGKGRVAWPSWQSVKVSTVVVIISTFIVGFYLFFCDSVLRWTLGKLLQG